MKCNFVHVLLLLFAALPDLVAKPEEESSELNDRPIIGVQAQTTYTNSSCSSYIAASYVKYLESAGARVVPVFNNLTEEQATELYTQLNGFLLPGGGIDVFHSGYGSNAKVFLNQAINGFDKSQDYFPIWGTCMGFQTLAMLVVGSATIMTKCNGVDYSVPLDFVEGYKDSKMFSTAPEEIIKYLSTLNVTYNHHHNCVTPQTYSKMEKLHDFFKVTSLNKGLEGISFISTFEGKKYPVYGTQWHPEKNSFEFPTQEHITHTAESVLITQYMANFFVNEARKNMHRFKTPEAEKNALIYNFNPIYPAKEGISGFKNFEQVYCFPG